MFIIFIILKIWEGFNFKININTQYKAETDTNETVPEN